MVQHRLAPTVVSLASAVSAFCFEAIRALCMVVGDGSADGDGTATRWGSHAMDAFVPLLQRHPLSERSPASLRWHSFVWVSAVPIEGGLCRGNPLSEED